MNSHIQEEPRAASAWDESPRSILIVDDDDVLVEILSRRLNHLGFLTAATDTGESALEIARAEHPSLILLDLRLPDADGFSICQQLADAPETCDIPVIILSGMERPDIIRRSRAVGCQYFVRKPYDPNALLLLIEQSLHEAGDW